jgi:hypothetical protein
LTVDNTGAGEPAPRLVIAVFAGPYNAGQALTALREAGFASEQVSVVARNDDTRGEIVEGTEMGESRDSGADSMVGALTGGALGGVLGLGALAIPVVGPIVAAGALASAIGGAAIGAAVGGQAGEEAERGLAGAGLAATLADRGVPETEALAYESRVRDNAILVAVGTPTEEAALAAHHLLDAHGGTEARIYGAALRREIIP